MDTGMDRERDRGRDRGVKEGRIGGWGIEGRREGEW
jgi:hypothetical protein